MKKLNLFLMLILVSYSAVYAQATFEENGILYMEDLSDPSKLAVVVISKNSPIYGNKSLYSGSLFVPAYVEHDMDRYEVTGIAQGAFSNGDKLEELIIEEGPTMVGDWAFNNTAFRRLIYPGSLKKLCYVYSPALEELIVGEGVVEINDVYVYEFDKLKKVVLPKSLEVINRCLFKIKDEDLKIGPNIREISMSFEESVMCRDLEIFGKSAKIFGSFNEFSTLQSLTLSGVSKISNSFRECPALQSLTMSGVSIISGAFIECPALNKINLGKVDTIEWSLDEMHELKELFIPKTCKKISTSFRGLTSLEVLKIEEGVESIEGSFDKMHNLKELFIPKTCKKISTSFSGLTSLEVLKIEEGVESIDDSFYKTENLRILYVPSTLSNDLSIRSNKLEEIHLTSKEPTEVCPEYIRKPNTNKLKVFVPRNSAENYRKAWGKTINPNKVEFMEE